MTTASEGKRMCIGVDCPNEAGTLQCPTCLKLGLKESYFCSQDCFKRSWVCTLPLHQFSFFSIEHRTNQLSCSLSTSSSTGQVISPEPFLRRMLFLNQILLQAPTIPFLRSPSPDHCDRYIRCRKHAKSPHRYPALIMRKTAFQEVNGRQGGKRFIS